ncbi:myosin ID heavy chain [Heterostelium album PN500]|uniref:Myosin ID heavy chain n=1 Tax=Heterostelium pallidum (strain ATCC 26659 / Pp 5 / PN500) TaxID=670386 RepID=D3BA71_HETP5|nr:myosin ID heavy chain [Heterostelium album PN500]EFA81458.1 myosin ID heavy chain [Heterostelium album PN500]|eukprot:XP_020433576.1 myosin ID heavy chain [Heterostelium album PN500]
MAYKSQHGVDDMVMLSKIANDSILDNLKKRYAADVIYTYIGNVLISVNPFKQIKNLYSERNLLEYRGKFRYELAPHVYAVADDMYRSMYAEGQSQCVIISGESGAGKTEAAKLIMQYIAAVSGKGVDVTRVKDVILESNPLLEAFGNAKTLRNNNSSRFGKYMEVQFDGKGDPEGGRVTNYLLEKSRVVYQTKGERNFHIFYQLLAGANAQLKNELRLESPDKYQYLSSSGCYTVDGVDDSQEFQDVIKAMKVIGVTEQEQKEVWRLIAAILNLGNIGFKNNNKDEAQIDTSSRKYVTSCEKALCYRTISTGTQGRSARVSTYACPQNSEGAYYSRDALAKALYSRLFDWIVGRVNIALGYKHNSSSLMIGILDIYGFEIFEKNGFEQMVINYVNERLQQIFIELTLKTEQEEYFAEGIQWEQIDYFNNKICCDLIDAKKPAGILTVLDDVCNFPKGDDDKFLQRMNESFGGHAHYMSAQQASRNFTIKHYAGDVDYCTDGFVDKNKDLLFNDLVELAACTSSKLIPQLFPEINAEKDKKKPTTAGFKIKESIGALVRALSACTPHYIRCIKPNGNKRANDFDTSLVMHQVKYLGLLENVRIRRAGYAYRQTYDKFFYRYRVCCKETWPNFTGGFEAGCEVILKSMDLDPKQFSKGKTKIFIRAPETVFNLEELRERKVFTYANKLQRFFLRFTLMSYYYSIQKSANDSLKSNKERRRLSIERPFQGDYINYRENFPLKDVVQKNGNEKMMFSHAVNKYDRRSRSQRRILILTDVALYFIAIEKNKDKEDRKKRPWIYVQKRRCLLTNIVSVELSRWSDGFVIVKTMTDHDQMFECRRKSEFIGTLMKAYKAVRVNYNNGIGVAIKASKQGGKGKERQISFEKGVKPETSIKGTKVLAPNDGLPADTVPNITPPEALPVVSIPIYRPAMNSKVAAGSSSSGASTAKPTAKALYDFDAESGMELSFKEGDILTVIDQSSGDWWDAELRGRKGKVPSNYLQLLKSSAPPTRAPPPSTSTSTRGGLPQPGAPRGGMPARGGAAPRGGVAPRGGMPARGGAAPRGGIASRGGY